MQKSSTQLYCDVRSRTTNVPPLTSAPVSRQGFKGKNNVDSTPLYTLLNLWTYGTDTCRPYLSRQLTVCQEIPEFNGSIGREMKKCPPVITDTNLPLLQRGMKPSQFTPADPLQHSPDGWVDLRPGDKQR
ncbi:hypothetical protein Bbelb_077760 [Branchiostoma belcheri]|nr:hypothetical protein Bbelb_077760 [Branchiostoma belcheri]